MRPSRAILEDDRTIFGLSGYARFLDVPRGKRNSSPRLSSENRLETTVTVFLLRCLRDELYVKRGWIHEMASISPLMEMIIVGPSSMVVGTLHSYTPVDDKDPTNSTSEAWWVIIVGSVVWCSEILSFFHLEIFTFMSIRRMGRNFVGYAASTTLFRLNVVAHRPKSGWEPENCGEKRP